MPGRVVVLATLAAAASLTGCGVGDDREQVRAAVERFTAALSSGDGQAACGALSPGLIETIESMNGGEECDAVVGELDVEAGAVRDVDVFATNAYAQIEGGETAFLSRERTGWRLTAIGCEPEAGKPRDRPYECAAES